MTESLTEALDILGKLFPMPRARWLKCRSLYELAQQAEGGCIVELGAATGTGAIALALGANVPVYAVDDYQFRQGWANEWYGPDNAVLFAENVKSANAVVELVLGDVRDVAKHWDEPVALVHWDLGMRSGMVRDFFLWEPHVISGGVIAVHDTGERDLGSVGLEHRAAQSGKFLAPELMGGGIWRFEKR